MQVLVIGGAGMLGHQLVTGLREGFEVRATLRASWEHYAGFGIFDPETTYCDVDVTDIGRVAAVLDAFLPDVVLNCAGLIKQREQAADPVMAIELNALFPHRLAALCRERKMRLVHFSTDCVFSGKTGRYLDDAPHDSQDLYGRTKSLGEVGAPGCLTLRTSIIGPELSNGFGLVEWFLTCKGRTPGYTEMIFSGLTTLAMTRLVAHILTDHPDKDGVYNVSAARISKYDLLCLLRNALGLAVDIVPDKAVQCDRSLDSTRFQVAFGYIPPSWPEMIAELATVLRRRPALAL